MNTITLSIPKSIELTDEQFDRICTANRDLRFERTATGELIIMTPTGGETGRQNSEILGQLWLWNRQHELGHVFDSSTGFKLPNGANRSPDAAWIPLQTWESLNVEVRKRFLPLAPDFVVELRSLSDELKSLQEKMREYLENGTRLGWLINPENEEVEVYRFGENLQVLNRPNSLSGEPLLPGFVLDLSNIWLSKM
ncbi:Uma2 family endonuclease [Baaleninema simplex]|uniref:Uma2 family endonuclease n=1 Tax=Baaleninema simplex TaxID=2862350 RepID=UPI000344B4E9|nr:Uma2 family endonuclease [Baaleninema simplex]